LKAADAKIQEVQAVKAQMQAGEFKLEDFYKWQPGIEDQFREQMNLDLPMMTDRDDRVMDSINPAQITADLKNGVRPEIFLYDEHKQVGDFNLDEEMALIDKGEWSIERLNKSRDERDAIHQKTLKALGKA